MKNGWINEWVNRWVDGWEDESQVNGWMNKVLAIVYML